MQKKTKFEFCTRFLYHLLRYFTMFSDFSLQMSHAKKNFQVSILFYPQEFNQTKTLMAHCKLNNNFIPAKVISRPNLQTEWLILTSLALLFQIQP